MDVLDSRREIENIDKDNVLGSIDALPDQCLDAYENASTIDVYDDYKKIEKVVMCGMGGSGLAARVIETVYFDELNIPLLRVNDYDLPKFTDEKTLVICSSYSGTTEEIISCANYAINKKAKWMVIGTGNTLIDLAKEHRVPFYQFNPKNNPSNQPRMAIGYSIVGQLVLSSKVGLFEFSNSELTKLVKVMRKVISKNNIDIETKENQAKKLAKIIFGKNVFYVAAKHLVGANHAVNNQMNENAKTFSADFVIPELNHHLMEGLKHPKENPENLFMFFANSEIYPKRIRKRIEVTMNVVEKNNIDYYEFKAESKTKLEQAFELIQFGAYVNFYLSVLYGQNPAPIPWVDYFKEQLGQPLGK